MWGAASITERSCALLYSGEPTPHQVCLTQCFSLDVTGILEVAFQQDHVHHQHTWIQCIVHCSNHCPYVRIMNDNTFITCSHVRNVKVIWNDSSINYVYYLKQTAAPQVWVGPLLLHSIELCVVVYVFLIYGVICLFMLSIPPCYWHLQHGYIVEQVSISWQIFSVSWGSKFCTRVDIWEMWWYVLKRIYLKHTSQKQQSNQILFPE